MRRPTSMKLRKLSGFGVALTLIASVWAVILL